MIVKALRKVLENAPDDAEVVVTDAYGKGIHLTNTPTLVGNIVYLDSIQEFPEDWYDENGMEINWVYNY